MIPDHEVVETDIGHVQVGGSRHLLLQHDHIARIPGLGPPQNGNEIFPFLLAEIPDWLPRNDCSGSAVFSVVSVRASAAVVTAEVPAALADVGVVMRPVDANVGGVVSVSFEVYGAALPPLCVLSADPVIGDWAARHLLQTLPIRTGSRDLSR